MNMYIVFLVIFNSIFPSRLSRSLQGATTWRSRLKEKNVSWKRTSVAPCRERLNVYNQLGCLGYTIIIDIFIWISLDRIDSGVMYFIGRNVQLVKSVGKIAIWYKVCKMLTREWSHSPKCGIYHGFMICTCEFFYLVYGVSPDIGHML